MLRELGSAALRAVQVRPVGAEPVLMYELSGPLDLRQSCPGLVAGQARVAGTDLPSSCTLCCTLQTCPGIPPTRQCVLILCSNVCFCRTSVSQAQRACGSTSAGHDNAGGNPLLLVHCSAAPPVKVDGFLCHCQLARSSLSQCYSSLFVPPSQAMTSAMSTCRAESVEADITGPTRTHHR